MLGKKPLEAVREVYAEKNLTENGVEKWADKVLEKPQVRREIVRILDGVHLTKRNLALKLFLLLNKPRGKDADKLRAIQMAFQMHGAFDPPEKEQTEEYDAMMLFVKIRKERGLEVPAQVEEAVKQLGIEAEVVQSLPAEIPTNEGTMKTGGQEDGLGK